MDLDGDGTGDVVVAGSIYGNTGMSVFFGPTTASATTNDAGFRLAPPSGAIRRWGMASELDFDEDGRRDLLYGSAPSGTVFVLSSSLRGDVNLNQAFLSVTTATSASEPRMVDGDLDGTGVSDLVIVTRQIPDAGAAVLLDPPHASMAFDDGAVWSVAPGVETSWTCAVIPDATGDGLDDLLLGSPETDQAFLVMGPATAGTRLDTDAYASFQGEHSGTNFGDWVEQVGDLDNDGNADLSINASLAAVGSDGGALFLWLSPVESGTHLAIDADLRIENEQAGEYGFPAPAHGDVNGDGATDLALGSSYYPGGGRNGAVYLLFGDPAP